MHMYTFTCMVPGCSHLGDQIRVADNGSHKETVVSNLCAHFHTGSAKIQVHLVVSTRDGSQSKIAHAVELQLEGQCWFQVPIDPVLLKLGTQAGHVHTKNHNIT